MLNVDPEQDGSHLWFAQKTEVKQILKIVKHVVLFLGVLNVSFKFYKKDILRFVDVFVEAV